MNNKSKYVIIYDSQKEFPLEKSDYSSDMVFINSSIFFETIIYKKKVRNYKKLREDIIMEQSKESNLEIQGKNGVYTLVKSVKIDNLEQLINKRKIKRNIKLNESIKFMLKHYKCSCYDNNSIAIIPELYEEFSMKYLSESFNIVEKEVSEFPINIKNHSMQELNNLLNGEKICEKNLKKFYKLIRQKN